MCYDTLLFLYDFTTIRDPKNRTVVGQCWKVVKPVKVRVHGWPRHLHHVPSAAVLSKTINEIMDYDPRIDRPTLRIVSYCGTVAYDCQKKTYETNREPTEN